MQDNNYSILYQKNSLIKRFLTNINEFDTLMHVLCTSKNRWRIMKSLLDALKCRRGIFSVITITIGILISTVVGRLLINHKWYDFIVIAGAIISVIGTQELSRLIIAFRDQDDSE